MFTFDRDKRELAVDLSSTFLELLPFGGSVAATLLRAVSEYATVASTEAEEAMARDFTPENMPGELVWALIRDGAKIAPFYLGREIDGIWAGLALSAIVGHIGDNLNQDPRRQARARVEQANREARREARRKQL